MTFSHDGDVITGDSSGRVTVWKRDATDVFTVSYVSSESMRQAHTVSLSFMLMHSSNDYELSSGTKILLTIT